MEDKVLIMCEFEHDEAIAFLSKCKKEGMTFSEKVTQLIKIFLQRGDNHLLRQTA